jgi:hypothetical protein
MYNKKIQIKKNNSIHQLLSNKKREKKSVDIAREEE